MGRGRKGITKYFVSYVSLSTPTSGVIEFTAFFLLPSSFFLLPWPNTSHLFRRNDF